jgi:PIN like domain
LTPSDGNSPRPLEGKTLFLERPLGKRVAVALRDMGVTVVAHWEVLAETASDAEYLGLCADKGWIPLTADSDVSTNPAQRLLIARGRLQVFRLTRNHWPWQEKLNAFVAALPSIQRLLVEPGPYIARINRKGEIARVEYLKAEDEDG